MRPRVFPAEDSGAAHVDHRAIEGASMRPRVFPAEDPWQRRRASSAPRPCFNEAAGIPRGRRGGLHHPRLGVRRFNEAAGIPRGRQVPASYSDCSRVSCFNEAAGIPRGRRDRPIRCSPTGQASMRPRVFPAEDPAPAADMHHLAVLQ